MNAGWAGGSVRDALRLWITGLRHVLAGSDVATAIEWPERSEAIVPAWTLTALTTVPGLRTSRAPGLAVAKANPACHSAGTGNAGAHMPPSGGCGSTGLITTWS